MKHTLPLICILAGLATGCSRQGNESAQEANTSHPGQQAGTATNTSGPITNGAPIDAFQAVFGEPKGSLTKGQKEILLYDGFQVETLNGKIYALPENFDTLYAKETGPSTLEKIKEVTKQIPAPQEIKVALAKRKAYALMDSQGNPVDHSSLASSGQVTVIEFCAPELEDSSLVSEHLKELLSAYEEVSLRQVEIESWNSVTARQFHISSVPDVRVLDRYGFLVAQPVIRIEKTDEGVDLTRVEEALLIAAKH